MVSWFQCTIVAVNNLKFWVTVFMFRDTVVKNMSLLAFYNSDTLEPIVLIFGCWYVDVLKYALQ